MKNPIRFVVLSLMLLSLTFLWMIYWFWNHGTLCFSTFPAGVCP